MTKAEIIALAERVERAEGPDRELDCLIAAYSGLHIDGTEKPVAALLDECGIEWLAKQAGRYQSIFKEIPHYTASLDAAMTLVPATYFWTLGGNVHHGYWFASINTVNSEGEPWCVACGNTAATPSLALTSASLRAIAEEMD